MLIILTLIRKKSQEFNRYIQKSITPTAKMNLLFILDSNKKAIQCKQKHKLYMGIALFHSNLNASQQRSFYLIY